MLKDSNNLDYWIDALLVDTENLKNAENALLNPVFNSDPETVDFWKRSVEAWKEVIGTDRAMIHSFSK
jgi:hypothetical protein